MKTGNVILTPYKHIEIVTRVDEHENEKESVVYTVSFEYPNSSGIHKLKDYIRTEICGCTANNGDPDDECTDCNGTGERDILVKGYSRSKVLGQTVKDYIHKSLLKGFEGLR